jgi:hypothetical protein
MAGRLATARLLLTDLSFVRLILLGTLSDVTQVSRRLAPAPATQEVLTPAHSKSLSQNTIFGVG